MSLTAEQLSYPVSREEMAYLGAQMVSSICTSSKTTAKVIRSGSFTDAAKINSDYQKLVIWFYNIGGIGGYADGTFRPQGTLTRSQGVSVFYNIFEVIIPNLQTARPCPPLPESQQRRSLSSRRGHFSPAAAFFCPAAPQQPARRQF